MSILFSIIFHINHLRKYLIREISAFLSPDEMMSPYLDMQNNLHSDCCCSQTMSVRANASCHITDHLQVRIVDFNQWSLNYGSWNMKSTSGGINVRKKRKNSQSDLCSCSLRLRMQSGLIKYIPFCNTVFTYLTARFVAISKRNISWVGAKTQVQYVNFGTFLLCWYRYILLCFFLLCFRHLDYCCGSEFKYPGTVAKSLCSIALEICSAPNPTLNLPIV